MTVLEQQDVFRATMLTALRKDLIGPGEPDEVISDPPITRYVSGIIFPTNSGLVAPDQDNGPDDGDAEADGDDGARPDPAIGLASVRYPSSFGLTFCVDTKVCNALRVNISAARYEEIEVERETRSAVSDAAPPALGRRALRSRTSSWQRIVPTMPEIMVDITETQPGSRKAIVDGLELYVKVRNADALGQRTVTLILLNTFNRPPGSLRDAYSWFQAAIGVVGAPKGGAVFTARETTPPQIDDDDLRSYELLFRDIASIAAGHGCSVSWKTAEDASRAIEINSEFLPEHELLLSDSNPSIDMSTLSYRALAYGNQRAVLAELRRFCIGYEEWIGTTQKAAKKLPDQLQGIASEHLARCDRAFARMSDGVSALEEDSDAWEAFRLTNHSMLVQRTRAQWLESGAQPGGPIELGTERWRPFQLAFILLCLRGLVTENNADREEVDLLWFPTGGGKTEAYLGLVAFLILLRRLRHRDHGAGVTVMMRYTLRLLTIQQFERAALLLCALEALRKSDERLGTEPIEIGLWVGLNATPNTLDEARRVLTVLRRNPDSPMSPLQLQRCPWCGKELGANNVFISNGPRRLSIACRTTDCDFRDELPVRVVDEDVYNRRPALLIATVDKFASLPWRDTCRSLFNLDDRSLRPPELIIQDELHLISGPLGTLTGLYETAIDLLCTSQGIRPKVIASTATIRRAHKQGRQLFDRDVAQFPPPGINGADSYFAVTAPRSERAGRRYAGVMAPGVSQTTLLVRTYAALLQAAQEVSGDDSVRDPYWTLVGYFNSLRVLGGARMQIQDDVTERIELLASEHGFNSRNIDERIELTSRESSSEIPRHLQRMAVRYPDPMALAIILATNMISVGVDVGRLGLMAVMGQPQSTSEYIQATSRVGRQHPGLVITMFNAAKSRDRSHYEAFEDYHSALYRQVEASSVTPFSVRSRDRGLHAVLIGLVRVLVPALSANDSAADIRRFRDLVKPVVDQIVRRAESVEPDEADPTRRHLEQILDEWERIADENPGLKYWKRGDADVSLLAEAGVAVGAGHGALSTLWSLRDVDQTSNAYQVVR